MSEQRITLRPWTMKKGAQPTVTLKQPEAPQWKATLTSLLIKVHGTPSDGHAEILLCAFLKTRPPPSEHF